MFQKKVFYFFLDIGYSLLKDILEINIPTGVPLIYEFDENLKSLRSYYLGDQEEIRKKIDAVAH
jgi:hypothetical protein